MSRKRSIIIKNKGDYLRILREFRPDWDLYFMKIANIVKNRSNCMKRRVGCVIVVG
jgi:dCMP deaminase